MLNIKHLGVDIYIYICLIINKLRSFDAFLNSFYSEAASRRASVKPCALVCGFTCLSRWQPTAGLVLCE